MKVNKFKLLVLAAMVLTLLLAVPVSLAAGNTVECDSSVTGTVNNTTPIVDYSFSAEAGTTVTFDMVSTDGLDPYLILLDSSGSQLATDDDGGESLNSQLEYTFDSAGEYTIQATRFLQESGSSEGTYNLSVSCGGCSEGETQEVTDTLTASEMEFPYTAEAGETVVVELVSEDFDTYLRLRDSAGNELATDDDGGEGLNSRMEYTFDSAGTYTVIVTSFGGSSTGVFTLTATSGGSCGCEATSDTLTGESTEYTYDADAGETVNIDLISSDFDTLVRVLDASGVEIASDDDGGDGLNSRLEGFTFATAGTYTIVVTSFGGRGTGNFDLYVCAEGSAPVAGESASLGSGMGEAISCGGSASGVVADDAPFAVFEFTATAGQTVTVDVVSSDGSLDPYAGVSDTELNILAEDDDGGEGLNSRVEYTFTEAGLYFLIATRYNFSEGTSSGGFTMTVSCR